MICFMNKKYADVTVMCLGTCKTNHPPLNPGYTLLLIKSNAMSSIKYLLVVFSTDGLGERFPDTALCAKV